MADFAWLSGKSILITGVAGFIGSHLADLLLAHQANVIGIDNFVTGQRDNLSHSLAYSNFTFIEEDCIKEPSAYVPTDIHLDAVLHFASPASPPRYQAHPIETYQVNAFATHLLLSYLERHNPSARFLFASTSEVYGNPSVHPQPESYWGNVNPNGIRSCYDESKRMGETICGVFHRDKNIDTRIVRIFNTYGPRMDAIDGRIIPNFVNQALDKKNLSIYGNGMQTRSFCHVSDLIEGIVSFLVHPDLRGETINLGNDEEHTAIDIATLIWQKVHPDESPTFSYHPLPEDDPIRRKPDLSKAKSLLDWRPRIMFNEGIVSVIEYFSEKKLTDATI